MRDRSDIARAVERHADTVLRVCTLYLRGKAERDDAFQETFMAYAQSSREFADEQHRKAWLITVARNACKDLLRKEGAPVVSLESLSEHGFDVEDQRDDAGERGRAEELARALRELDEPYRIVLHLKYYEGYQAADIARMLEVPENTVYTRLARGRTKLKEVLSRA